MKIYQTIGLRLIVVLLLFVQVSAEGAPPETGENPASESLPNIVLMMADDLGWGDVHCFNPASPIMTSQLDAMAAAGMQFNRFYASSPVCSPTRGSCLTGRHPFGFGIYFANSGHMKSEELTLAELLRTQGYATGHFEKWHLGTLTTEMKDANRGKPGKVKDFSPPWKNGFDVCFSTESKVPTWDPMLKPGSVTEFPAVTSDYLPTIMEAVGVGFSDDRPRDGISLLPMLDGQQTKRQKPIGFESKGQLAWTTQQYKLFSKNNGKTWELYDLLNDPSEKNDIVSLHPKVVQEMSQSLAQWRDSCRHSDRGDDY